MLTDQWRKSSRSGHNGACVEARLYAAGVQLRDSKVVDGPTLSMSGSNFASFLKDTTRGSFTS